MTNEKKLGAQHPHPNPLPEGEGPDEWCCANPLLLLVPSPSGRGLSPTKRSWVLNTLTQTLSQRERGLMSGAAQIRFCF